MLENPNYDYIYRLIYTFHMPLFMGICGYFFAKSVEKLGRQEYIRIKLKQRLLGLIVPMCSFGFLVVIIHRNFSILSYLQAVHDVWFLGDLGINTILVLIILKWCDGKFVHDVKYFILGIPFASIPKIGYFNNGMFMYLFFVSGYWLAIYYGDDFYKNLRYWKCVLVIFIMSFIAFELMPYEPSGFIFSRHDYVKMIVIDSMKIIMGIAGCYLILVLIHKIIPFLKGTLLERCAVDQGRYTLDIYLLNIIIIEKIAGPSYRQLVDFYDFNLLHSYGLLFEILSTFLCACLMMGVIMFVGKMINKNRYLAKIFFYR